MSGLDEDKIKKMIEQQKLKSVPKKHLENFEEEVILRVRASERFQWVPAAGLAFAVALVFMVFFGLYVQKKNIRTEEMPVIVPASISEQTLVVVEEAREKNDAQASHVAVEVIKKVEAENEFEPVLADVSPKLTDEELERMAEDMLLLDMLGEELEIFDQSEFLLSDMELIAEGSVAIPAVRA